MCQRRLCLSFFFPFRFFPTSRLRRLKLIMEKIKFLFAFHFIWWSHLFKNIHSKKKTSSQIMIVLDIARTNPTFYSVYKIVHIVVSYMFLFLLSSVLLFPDRFLSLVSQVSLLGWTIRTWEERWERSPIKGTTVGKWKQSETHSLTLAFCCYMATLTN